jgi:hypothetical protein
MLEHLTRQGVTERLELVLVDRGVTAAAVRKLGRRQGLEVRRVGWDAGSLSRRRRRPLPVRSSRHICESPRIVW